MPRKFSFGETEMRTLILAIAVWLALAVSTQAAPLAPIRASVEPGAAPPVELVAGGCGWGWHRRHWQDRQGNWHWGGCLLDNGPSGAWGAGWHYSYPYWHGVYPAWGWGYQ